MVEHLSTDTTETGLLVGSEGLYVCRAGEIFRAKLTAAQWRDLARRAELAAVRLEAPELAATRERALRAWQHAEVADRRRIERNAARPPSNEPERRDPALHRKLWTMLSAFALAHGKGKAPMPPAVALWLHVEIDAMLAGHPPLDFQRKARGTSRTPLATMCQQVAVEVIELARVGRIALTEEEAKAQILKVFPVSLHTLEEWGRELGPHGSLILYLDELPPGSDATEFCLRQLRKLGARWRDETLTRDKAPTGEEKPRRKARRKTKKRR